MRNGNILYGIGRKWDLTVLTVPMRNGNWEICERYGNWRGLFLPYLWGMETQSSSQSPPSLTRSYRTYEEWKLFVQRTHWTHSNVLTVPMRNGNFNSSNVSRIELLFLPYLWGMETEVRCKTLGVFVSSYRTYEEWKLSTMLSAETSNTVLTVPMRNGNWSW